MIRKAGLHGASLMLVRRILDDFCEEHRMAISDRTAVEAARLLIGLAVSEQEEPMAMRQKVEDWFSRSQRNA
ncbi:hypothetical protein FY145_10585 [Agrobacterium tumefaciens]|uniref:Uncharacterized protein n=1 Tax=Agrobacterium tumefaciens TaxID=358 RepID=A0AAP9E407_AGRTU|nr:hypothetical protein [Agrobacterium tumefaciens]NSZ58468.1 hypothetical protein [Agrobacterium tumefaciens]QDY94543.1 hypothetical protein CG010_010700 [Agrobacterium tumefaciens]UXS49670.1 hypothetical protein FY149_21030 [Agrobacterium tumefaciens]UXS70920.1 hypothetical protein FY146_10585 [Agrobacterium tumefaciens]UXS78583.1 hypothetical protein FY145_10585 [Agrobacterium tumefaciens]